MSEENTNTEEVVDTKYKTLEGEAVKYHKRAQDAEAKLAAIEQERQEEEAKRLAEQGKFRELSETQAQETKRLKAELEARTVEANQWNSYQTTKKEKLLAQLDEAERETFQDLPLTALETVVTKLTGIVQNTVTVNNNRPVGVRHTWRDKYADKAEYAKHDPNGYRASKANGEL